MAKKGTPESKHNHSAKHVELDMLHNSLHDEVPDKELGDIIITTEESIIVTLFEEAPGEEDEEAIDELFTLGKNNKKTTLDEDGVEDFDSYFFEE